MKRHSRTEHQYSSLSTSCLEVPCDTLPHTTTMDCSFSYHETKHSLPYAACQTFATGSIKSRITSMLNLKWFLRCDKPIRVPGHTKLGALGSPN